MKVITTLRLLFAAALAFALAVPSHATNNVPAKNWYPMTTCFDGYIHSDYPIGDCPSGYQTTLTLLDTDLVDVDTTHGENSKGSYLTLFGYTFGRQDQLGTASGTRVYLRNTTGPGAWNEVDNYRYVQTSRTWPVLQVMTLGVQVGSLGAMAAGTVMDIMTCTGACPAGGAQSILTAKITVQPGRFAFVSNTTGSDATGLWDTIGSPFRYVQKWDGGAQTNFSGIWCPAANCTAQGENGIKAGDTIVMRGQGTNWVDQNGFEQHLMKFSQQTGTAPNGTIGNGYIHFVRYPGPALGNAPENVHIVIPSTVTNIGAGGFHGVGGANSDLGYGRYWTVSGMWIEASATSRDGPINMQSSAQTVKHDVRIMDNELGPWPCTISTYSDCRSAGIAGNSYGAELKFNYSHDIGGSPTALENHGIYLDGSQHSARDVEIAYNWITNITGGSCIQTHNQAAPDNIQGITVHHNFMDTCTKYGMNIDVAVSLDFYDNILINPGTIPVTWDSFPAAPTINITHNTIRSTACTPGNLYGIFFDKGGATTTGTFKIQHNVMVWGVRPNKGCPYYSLNGSSTITTAENLYYDESGVQNTVPTSDNTGLCATPGACYGNPLFTSVAGGNYTLAAGSPGLAACTLAEAIAVATDLFGIARPVPGTGAPGGTKNDIGATQGIGT